MFKIRHVGIITKNMTEMTKFYEELGFKKCWDKIEYFDKINMDIHTIKLKNKENFVIELCDNHQSKIHFAFNSAKEKQAIRWIYDPDGNGIEIVNEKLL